jgi:hypothetical protein
VTVAVDPGQFSLAEHGQAPSLPAVHGLGLNESGQAGQAQVTKKDSNGPTLVDRHGEKKGNSHVASLSEASTSRGLARAIQAVENTTVREARPAESPMHAADAMHHDVHLAKALATLTSLSEGKSESPSGNPNGNAYANNAGQGSSNESANGRSGGNGNGNAYGLNGGNGIGNAFGLSAAGMVVTPPAVMTGAGNGVGNGSGGGPGNGNGNGYGHHK